MLAQEQDFQGKWSLESYSELKNCCNVWQFWIVCNVVFDSMGILLRVGRII